VQSEIFEQVKIVKKLQTSLCRDTNSSEYKALVNKCPDVLSLMSLLFKVLHGTEINSFSSILLLYLKSIGPL
jgi:hypothetical protein